MNERAIINGLSMTSIVFIRRLIAFNRFLTHESTAFHFTQMKLSYTEASSTLLLLLIRKLRSCAQIQYHRTNNKNLSLQQCVL